MVRENGTFLYLETENTVVVAAEDPTGPPVLATGKPPAPTRES